MADANELDDDPDKVYEQVLAIFRLRWDDPKRDKPDQEFSAS